MICWKYLAVMGICAALSVIRPVAVLMIAVCMIQYFTVFACLIWYCIVILCDAHTACALKYLLTFTAGFLISMIPASYGYSCIEEGEI